MFLIFYALRRELGALRRRVVDRAPLSGGLHGFSGRIGGAQAAFVATGIGIERGGEISRRAMQRFAHPRLVISTGVAGGLAPPLRAGDLVISDVLLMEQPGGGYNAVARTAPATLQQVRAALARRGLNATAGPTLSVPRVISSAANKTAVHARSGAMAVDMESAAIAIEAQAAGAAFVCVRAVIDEAADDLPGAELAGESGNVSALSAAAFLLKNPSALARVPAMVRHFKRATASIASALEAICAASDI